MELVEIIFTKSMHRFVEKSLHYFARLGGKIVLIVTIKTS